EGQAAAAEPAAHADLVTRAAVLDAVGDELADDDLGVREHLGRERAAQLADQAARRRRGLRVGRDGHAQGLLPRGLREWGGAPRTQRAGAVAQQGGDGNLTNPHAIGTSVTWQSPCGDVQLRRRLRPARAWASAPSCGVPRSRTRSATPGPGRPTATTTAGTW